MLKEGEVERVGRKKRRGGLLKGGEVEGERGKGKRREELLRGGRGRRENREKEEERVAEGRGG